MQEFSFTRMGRKGMVLAIVLSFEGCGSPSTFKFSDLVEVEKIEKVYMTNHAGSFDLSPQQLEQLKGDLASMVLDPSISVKVGAISMEVVVDGKVYQLLSATHGGHIEVPAGLVSKKRGKVEGKEDLYFKVAGANFDNYLPQ